MTDMTDDPYASEILMVAYVDGALHLVNLKDKEIVSGPFDTFEDVHQAAQTRAFRLAQGWRA
jgi:hypothetical protein